jgi:hypothetical protein
MKKFYLLISALIFISLTTIAQVDIDIVYLKNGSIIKGKIIEEVPNQSIKIKTGDGNIFVYKIDEIEKITKETVEDEESFEPFKKTSQNKGFIGSISGGLGIPVGELANGWLLGFNVTGNAGYVFNNLIATRLDISYNNFAYNTPSGLSGISGGSFTIISLRGDLLIGNFNKKSFLVPYLFLGPGVYFKSVGDFTYLGYTIKGSSETEFGLGIGSGLGFKAAKNVAIFVEGQFNIGFGNKPVSQFIPFKAGILITP